MSETPKTIREVVGSLDGTAAEDFINRIVRIASDYGFTADDFELIQDCELDSQYEIEEQLNWYLQEYAENTGLGMKTITVSKKQYWNESIDCPLCGRENDVTEGSHEMLSGYEYIYTCAYCNKKFYVEIEL